MWQVMASVHYQESRYSTRVIRIPPFIVNHAENELDLKDQVNKIVNPINNPNVTIIMKGLKKI